MSLHVLFVCTANICRSPIAQRLLVARLGESGAIQTSSAGVRALTGHAMDATSAAVLTELGGDPSGHVAQQLTAELISRVDLILTATSAQRVYIISEQPMVMRRAFTLREFVRLGGGLPAGQTDSLQERVAEVAGQRGIAPPPGASGDDIGDPFGAPLPVVRACGQQISDAVDGLLRVLGPART